MVMSSSFVTASAIVLFVCCRLVGRAISDCGFYFSYDLIESLFLLLRGRRDHPLPVGRELIRVPMLRAVRIHTQFLECPGLYECRVLVDLLFPLASSEFNRLDHADIKLEQTSTFDATVFATVFTTAKLLHLPLVTPPAGHHMGLFFKSMILLIFVKPGGG
jgi:hypothetical protein